MRHFPLNHQLRLRINAPDVLFGLFLVRFRRLPAYQNQATKTNGILHTLGRSWGASSSISKLATFLPCCDCVIIRIWSGITLVIHIIPYSRGSRKPSSPTHLVDLYSLAGLVDTPKYMLQHDTPLPGIGPMCAFRPRRREGGGDLPETNYEPFFARISRARGGRIGPRTSLIRLQLKGGGHYRAVDVDPIKAARGSGLNPETYALARCVASEYFDGKPQVLLATAETVQQLRGQFTGQRGGRGAKPPGQRHRGEAKVVVEDQMWDFQAHLFLSAHNSVNNARYLAATADQS